MEMLQWIGMIVGIILLLWFSVRILIRSEEKVNKSTRAYRQNQQQTKQLHEELDGVITTLKNQNEGLEKVRDFFVKLNTRLFKK